MEHSSLSFYQRHEKAFGNAEVILTALLGVLPIFATHSIDACIDLRGSTVDVLVFIGMILYCVVYITFFAFLHGVRKSVLDSKDDIIESQESEIESLTGTYDESAKLQRCYRDLLAGVSGIAEKNARMANDAVHTIVENGHPLLNRRSYEQDCKSVCTLLRNALNCYYGSDIKFEVSYDMRDESSDILAITMVGASATDGSERFSCLDRRRSITDRQKRYDLKLFKSYEAGETEHATILLSADEVRKCFLVASKNSSSRQHGVSRDKDYRQYVAIPVFCPATEGSGSKKIVGLLQVAVVDGEVWTSRSSARNVVGYFMAPLANQLLLIHKLGNALRAAPPRQPTASNAKSKQAS